MMQYYTAELWWKINDEDENTRKQAEEEWDRNRLLYQRQFEEAKKRLPRKFIKDFLAREELHDYVILGIAVAKKGKNYSCHLQLTNHAETVILEIDKLKALQIDMETFKYCMMGMISWGYTEFEIISENVMQMAVLCDMQNEMRFQFHSIKLIKQ